MTQPSLFTAAAQPALRNSDDILRRNYALGFIVTWHWTYRWGDSLYIYSLVNSYAVTLRRYVWNPERRRFSRAQTLYSWQFRPGMLHMAYLEWSLRWDERLDLLCTRIGVKLPDRDIELEQHVPAFRLSSRNRNQLREVRWHQIEAGASTFRVERYLLCPQNRTVTHMRDYFQDDHHHPTRAQIYHFPDVELAVAAYNYFSHDMPDNAKVLAALA